MCHFITLVAPCDREDDVAKVLAAHGRIARRISNPDLARRTPPGSAQFLTTRSCDCGTSLGRTQPAPQEVASRHDKEVGQLRKKGWSDSKIARSLAEKEAARSSSTARKPIDSVELWENIVSDLVSHPRASGVGLFLHSYRGGLADEPLEPKVLHARADVLIGDTLRALEEDELAFFG
jgi:hypothetical protein